MLERKIFVDKAPEEELVADGPHVLLGNFMFAHFLFSVVEALRSQAKFLGHTFKEGLPGFLFLRTRCLNSRNESYQDLMLLSSFDQANVLIIGTTLLNSNPPVFAHFVVFSFVILVDRGHLLCGE